MAQGIGDDSYARTSLIQVNMGSTQMAEGNGDDSYARTSMIQAFSIEEVFPVIKDALEGFYSEISPKCIRAAELGCGIGPNVLKVLPHIIDITNNTYNHKNVPEIIMFLNDIPTNDFNTTCAYLPTFHKELNEKRGGDIVPYFINTTPGNYYERLFPFDFLHFVHCSNSVHWLSKMPKKLKRKSGEYINKGNIYIDETSPPEVLEAYQEQYKEDFTSFLKYRGQEIVQGGRMVLNIMASTKNIKPQDFFMLKFINIVLKEMASKGSFDSAKLDSFDIQFYPPTEKEVRGIIESEGSFTLHEIKHFTIDWDAHDSKNMNIAERGKFSSGPMKSTTKNMIASHFGDEIIEEYYSRLTDIVTKELNEGRKLELSHQVISLIKN